jgi:hypothetical protein
MLRRSLWPELALEEFVAEVSARLAGVGLQLASGDGYWLARAQEGEARDGFEPIFSLDQLELAVLAALYLHLRYLPRQAAGVKVGDESDVKSDLPSVSVEDIERGLPGYSVGKVQMVLGRLKNAQFVRQNNQRLYAGPYLAAIDEVVADERASELLRDFRLRRYLQRVVRGEADTPVDADEAPPEDGAAQS